MAMEKKEIINGRRNEKVGSAFAAIQMFADSIKFYDYSLVADHGKGTVLFKAGDYSIKCEGDFFDSDLEEIMEIMDVEKKKGNI